MSEDKYYVGWDVGAWSCKASSKSQDALVIVDENETVVGTWRGNLREIISESENTYNFLKKLFEQCSLTYSQNYVTLAIDAPLGYSKAFIQLVSKYLPSEEKFDIYEKNPYLFRATERHISQQKFLNTENRTIRPLSAVNDMIGSQSTKGMHVISKFAQKITSPGIWSDDDKLRIIETYPSINREIENSSSLEQKNKDIKDAYICAEIARRFDKDPKHNDFVLPPKEIPGMEGWIWYLKK